MSDALTLRADSVQMPAPATAPAPGEDRTAWASRTASDLRHAPDADKLGLLSSLEGFVSVSGHDGWAAVYDNPEVVGTLATSVQETGDDDVVRCLMDFLVKAYRDHQDDGSPASENIKNTATWGMVNTFGSEIIPILAGVYQDDDLATDVSNRAEYALNDDFIRAGENTPELDKMGISGAGETVLVADAEGQDHMAHTTYLADPARSGSLLIPYGCASTTGHAFVEDLLSALKDARDNGADAVSVSVGIAWDSDGPDYVEKAGGDEAAGRAQFEADMESVSQAVDALPGVMVIAAGNGGPGSAANELGRNPKVLVAAALDRGEDDAASFDSPALHPENVVGVGTAVWALGVDGALHFLEDATSWAAPQIAHDAACVFQAGKQFGQGTNAGEVHTILVRTAEPVRNANHADVCCAVRFAKTLAYLKSTGDGGLVQALWDLAPDKARQVADACEPLLHALGPGSQQHIASIVRG
jgi:hypothetical protein